MGRNRKRRTHTVHVRLLLLACAILLVMWIQVGRIQCSLPDGAQTRAEMARLNALFIANINAYIEGMSPDSYLIEHSEENGLMVSNWRDMVAVSVASGRPLEQIFAEMVIIHTWYTPLSGGKPLYPAADGTFPAAAEQTRLLIQVTCMTAQEAKDKLKLTWSQRRTLAALMAQPKDEQWDRLLSGQDGGTPCLPVPFPAGLDPARQRFLSAACSLVGRVSYFWGGKSHRPDWDPRWGVPALVLAPGGPASGTVIPYGLDCSGLVSWAAASASPSLYESIGEGVRAQYAGCAPVAWDQAQPGDLLFFPDLSHVGIMVGRDEQGHLLVVHCSHSQGGVVLNQDAAAIGFTQAGQPAYFA